MANLKLMIDACFWSIAEPLAKVSSSIDVKTSEDCGFSGRTSDAVLVAATRTKGRILVTQDDNTIKIRDYPPCKHGGVIFIQAKNLPETEFVKMFKAFSLSGERSHAVGHMTYLSRRSARIITHKERIEIKWSSGTRKKYEVQRHPL